MSGIQCQLSTDVYDSLADLHRQLITSTLGPIKAPRKDASSPLTAFLGHLPKILEALQI